MYNPLIFKYCRINTIKDILIQGKNYDIPEHECSNDIIMLVAIVMLDDEKNNILTFTSGKVFCIAKTQSV